MEAKHAKEKSPLNNENLLNLYLKVLQLSVFLLFILAAGLFYWISDPTFGTKKAEVAVVAPEEQTNEIDPESVVNGIHLGTGLAMDESFQLVRSNCTACHSGKLIAQNKATKEGWKEIITWMQETQKLWDLGENEEAILTYLAKHYAPDQSGRRMPLTNIQWYELHQ